AACAAIPEEPVDADGTLLIDASGSFVNADIDAAAGDTLIILNHSDSLHTVTSQSAPGAFDDTGDFDVIVTAGSSNTLTVPAGAASGDVLYFYCRFHLDSYANPD